jgi:hypothetical protein
MKKVFCLFVAIMCLALPVASKALGGLDTTAGGAGYEEKDILKISGNAINIALSFVGVLFLVMMIAGGFVWMTAAGNEARVKTALKLLTAGIIGLVIVVAAYVITAWLGDTLKW